MTAVVETEAMVLETQERPTPAHRAALAAAIYSVALAAVVAQALPVLIATLTAQLHLTTTQSGLLAASDLGAGTLASIVATRTPWRYNPSVIARFGVVVMILANLGCIAASSFAPLLALRLLAGVGEGAVTMAGVAVYAKSKSPERTFALGALAQALAGSALMAIVPMLTTRFGWSASFALIVIAAVPALWASRLFGQAAAPAKPSAARAGPGMAGWLAILAMTAAFCGLGASWVNLGRVAEHAHLKATETAFAVSAASLAMPVAVALAALIGDRLPNWLCLGGATAAMLTGLGLIGTSNTAALFASGAAVWAAGWAFYVPYMGGVTAGLDRTGGVSVIANGCANGGFALGPILAIPLLQHWGVVAAPYMTSALLLVALVLVIKPILQTAAARSAAQPPKFGRA